MQALLSLTTGVKVTEAALVAAMQGGPAGLFDTSVNVTLPLKKSRAEGR